jgi:hypothetical protein
VGGVVAWRGVACLHFIIYTCFLRQLLFFFEILITDLLRIALSFVFAFSLLNRVLLAYGSIKFATDLVVFPLLWLYRLARITKRRMLRLLGRGPGKGNNKEKNRHGGSAVNGDATSAVNGDSTSGGVDWKNSFKPNGEQ